jgi:hypothetical protein
LNIQSLTASVSACTIGLKPNSKLQTWSAA